VASGLAEHRRLADQVEQLRDGPLASVLEIPEPYQPDNDAHLEQVAGQLLEHFRLHDDVESYVLLVELTQVRLLRVAIGVTRRLALRIDPEDLVAAFMARLFTDVRKPRPGGPVRRFLALAYTMMRFDALNQLRLMRRSRERGIRFEQHEAVRRKPLDPVMVADARERSVGLARVGMLLLTVVSQCFQQLRIRDRRILLCREIEGLCYDEIATTMDLPRTQVGMILKRARERLMDRMTAALPDTNATAPLPVVRTRHTSTEFIR
jgi:RNA polymerase sigma factor (sigma-70 family)